MNRRSMSLGGLVEGQVVRHGPESGGTVEWGAATAMAHPFTSLLVEFVGPSATVHGDPRTCPECVRLDAARTRAWARRDPVAEAACGERVLGHLVDAHRVVSPR